MSDYIPPPMSESTPKKKHHWIRWTLGIIAAVFIILIGVGLATSSNPQTTATVSNTPQAKATYTPYTPSAAPSPTIMPANKVAFIISGNVPSSQFGGVDITYGSNSDTHDVIIPSINGKIKYVMRFDSNASYYSIDVSFSSAGNINCKIVALGPSPDVPLVVSHGSSTGGSNGGLCTAQAAPDNANGTSWQNES